MSNIEQLKKLILEGGYDEESREQVSSLEDRLHILLIAERLQENPVIAEFILYLRDQSDKCTYLLSNDRKLTELERLNLFDKRDLCDQFTKLFNGEDKKSVEESIEQSLNRVKNV